MAKRYPCWEAEGTTPAPEDTYRYGSAGDLPPNPLTGERLAHADGHYFQRANERNELADQPVHQEDIEDY